MVNDRYLIVGNAKISGFDYNAALTALLNAGLTFYQAEQQAKAQQKQFEQQQALAAYNAATGQSTSGSFDFKAVLPYLAIGGVLLVLLMRKR